MHKKNNNAKMESIQILVGPKPLEGNKIVEDVKVLVSSEPLVGHDHELSSIICKHCKKPIANAKLVGVCPSCGKLQDDSKNSVRDSVDTAIICKHCGNSIDEVKMVGLSLVCPSCGVAQ